jgi:hypothetical protein
MKWFISVILIIIIILSQLRQIYLEMNVYQEGLVQYPDFLNSYIEKLKADNQPYYALMDDFNRKMEQFRAAEATYGQAVKSSEYINNHRVWQIKYAKWENCRKNVLKKITNACKNRPESPYLPPRGAWPGYPPPPPANVTASINFINDVDNILLAVNPIQNADKKEEIKQSLNNLSNIINSNQYSNFIKGVAICRGIENIFSNIIENSENSSYNFFEDYASKSLNIKDDEIKLNIYNEIIRIITLIDAIKSLYTKDVNGLFLYENNRTSFDETITQYIKNVNESIKKILENMS